MVYGDLWPLQRRSFKICVLVYNGDDIQNLFFLNLNWCINQMRFVIFPINE